MITEDYCSYEVAKLLKDKGFDEPCRYIYDTFYESEHLIEINDNVTNYDLDLRDYVCYLAPTLQMACKWLREVYNTCICINMVSNGDDSYVLFTYNIYQNKNYKLIFGSNVPKYNSYEEAVEAALKYTLENLI